MSQIIDTEPGIDSQSEEGVPVRRDQVKGRIQFKNVTFAYPTRPDVLVLENFSLTIEPGVLHGLLDALWLLMSARSIAFTGHENRFARVSLSCVPLHLRAHQGRPWPSWVLLGVEKAPSVP